MIRILAVLIALASPAGAQVLQSGSVTPGHPSAWISSGVIGDAGTPANGILSGVGVTYSGSGICQNSAAAGTGNYNQLCFTVTSTGASFTLYNYGSATGGFTLNYNGASIPFNQVPGGSGANIQYNNSLAFAGISQWTSNGTTAMIGSTTAALQWNSDTYLYRGAAGLLTLSDSTTPTQIDVYNTVDTATGPTNYERGIFGFIANSNVLTIGTQASGTGSTRNIEFVVGATNIFDYGVTNSSTITFNKAVVIPTTSSISATGTISINGSSSSSAYFFGNHLNSIATLVIGSSGSDFGQVGSVGTNNTWGLCYVTSQTNAIGTCELEWNASGLLIVPQIGTDSTHTTSTICQDTTSHALYFGSGSAGICAGTSGAQFKTGFSVMTAGLKEISRIRLWNYHYREGYGDNGARLQYGPTAQDVEAAMPDLVLGRDEIGRPINYDIGAFIPISMHAFQQIVDSCRDAANDNFCVHLLERVNEK